VARVGLAPNEVLAAQFSALDHLAPGRVIAGLGTGDRLNEEENRAYGIPFPPAAERRAQLVELGRQLGAAGLTVWIAVGARGAPRRSGRRLPSSTCGTPIRRWWRCGPRGPTASR